MENLLYYIWFAEAMGPGNRKAALLLSEEENPYRIYAMSSEQLAKAFSVELSRQELWALSRKDTSRAAYYLEFCRRKRVDILHYHHPAYPDKLKQLYNPPVVLYCYGQLPNVDEQLTIAMVGSRTATAYGMTLTEKLSRELARYGVVVVSGLARGIDTMASRGALVGEGKNIAVLGSGINVPYPKENRELMRAICRAGGAVITEYPPDSKPEAWHFPQRNRIISGLSDGVVVTEAHSKSGALITADLALQQGKEVFAVPGGAQSSTHAGCNRLIQSGTAKLVTSTSDILEEYSGRLQISHKKWETEPSCDPIPEQEPSVQPGSADAVTSQPAEEAERDWTVRQREICHLLAKGTMQLDQLAQQVDYPVGELIACLTELELEGCVEQMPGRRFCLK
ncbi:MAG: DNA-processing protein DprA [Eubacteriales bacterium]|jgi:DNA processing protein